MCSACLMHCIGVHVHSCSSHSLQILEKAAEIVGASDCASMVSQCATDGSLVLVLTVILFTFCPFFLNVLLKLLFIIVTHHQYKGTYSTVNFFRVPLQLQINQISSRLSWLVLLGVLQLVT